MSAGSLVGNGGYHRQAGVHHAAGVIAVTGTTAVLVYGRVGAIVRGAVVCGAVICSAVICSAMAHKRMGVARWCVRGWLTTGHGAKISRGGNRRPRKKRYQQQPYQPRITSHRDLSKHTIGEL